MDMFLCKKGWCFRKIAAVDSEYCSKHAILSVLKRPMKSYVRNGVVYVKPALQAQTGDSDG